MYAPTYRRGEEGEQRPVPYTHVREEFDRIPWGIDELGFGIDHDPRARTDSSSFLATCRCR